MSNISTKTKNISPAIVIIILLFVIIMLTIKEQYEYMIAFSGIVFGILAPYFTKDVELEKHRQQLIFERRQNSYAELMLAIVEYRANLIYIQGRLFSLLMNKINKEGTNILLKEVKDAFDEHFEKFKKVDTIIAHCYTLFPSELIEFISVNLNKKATELNDVYKKTFDELMGNDQEFTEEKYNLIDKIIIEMSGIIGGIIMRIRKNTGIDD